MGKTDSSIMPSYSWLPFIGGQAMSTSVSGGYSNSQLDLNQHLISHPEATFFLQVQGQDMRDAGIQDRDLLIVDRSLKATHEKIVVAVANGELVVRRLLLKHNQVTLVAEYANQAITEPIDQSSLEIWGVVTSVIHKL